MWSAGKLAPVFRDYLGIWKERRRPSSFRGRQQSRPDSRTLFPKKDPYSVMSKFTVRFCGRAWLHSFFLDLAGVILAVVGRTRLLTKRWKNLASGYSVSPFTFIPRWVYPLNFLWDEIHRRECYWLKKKKKKSEKKQTWFVGCLLGKCGYAVATTAGVL